MFRSDEGILTEGRRGEGALDKGGVQRDFKGTKKGMHGRVRVREEV